MIFIYNRNEEQIATLDVIPTLTEEIGKLNTLEFESSIEFEKGFEVVYMLNKKPYVFKIVDIDYTRGDIPVHTYYCQDSLIELQVYPVMDIRPEGSFQHALTQVLQNTRYELVVQPDYDMSQTLKSYFYRKSVFESFAEIVESYRIEWFTEYEFSNDQIVKRKLVIGKRGNRSNGRLEFGKNIKVFNRKILSDNVITALYGFGKGEEITNDIGEATGGYGRRIDFSDINGGKAYVENLEALEEFGIGPVGNKQHSFGFVIFEEVTDKQILLDLTKEQLDIMSQIQAQHIVDASNIGIDCRIGDEVPVIDDEINYQNYSRILKVVTIGDDIEFTFGTVTGGYISESQKTLKQVEKELNNTVISVMEYTLKQITDSYFGEDGYNYDLRIGNEYGLPAGLYSFDAPIDQNPTKVVYVGAGKVLIANEKGTDGKWIWKTAITGDGVVGSNIIANTITANQLSSDVMQELLLKSQEGISLSVQEYLEANPPAKGEDGTDGKTAYEIALENGFVGTEQEWLDSLQGIGKDGKSVVELIEYYYLSDSGTEQIGGIWSTEPPQAVQGKWIWTKLETLYSDDSTSETNPIATYIPVDGQKGDAGNDGDDGISVIPDIEFAVNTSIVNPPTSGWTTSAPTRQKGQVIWQRTKFTYSDGRITYSDPVPMTGDSGDKGQDGLTPYPKDGYWYIGDVNTGQKITLPIHWKYSNDKITMNDSDSDERYTGFFVGDPASSNPDDYVWLDRTDTAPLYDRLKQVEANIQINKDSIASKVEQTTYTADQKKVNEQLGTITQTFDEWQTKFDNIGGTNLLRNSRYLTEWQPVGIETITETYFIPVPEWKTINATNVKTSAPDTVSKRKAFKRFEVPTDIQGRVVTFSMYVKNVRDVAQSISVDGVISGSYPIPAGWEGRVIITGYASNVGYLDVFLESYGAGYYFEAIVYKAMLEIGNQLNEWTPHPDDISSGSTTITEEGLTVGRLGSEVQTSVANSGMYITDNVSNENIAEFTRDGTKTDVLNAREIYSDSIIRRQKNSTDIYVGPSMTGDGSGKDSSNRLDNINRAIEIALNYSHYVTDYAVINVHVTGTINEIVYINGISGYGTINLIGETNQRLVGAIFVNSCSAEVNIKNINVSLDAPNSVNACVNYHNATSGIISGCTLVGQGAGRGVNVTKSKVKIEGTQFFDLSTALIATELGEILAIDNRGGTITYPESVTKGGRLILQGTRFFANRSPTPDAYLPLGGWELDNSKGTGGTRPTFAPPTFGNVSKTFYANLATANSNGYEWLEGEARQGVWNGKINIGIAKFGSQIKDWLDANGGYQGSVTAVITAKRNNSSGYGTVSLKIDEPYDLTLPAIRRGERSSATAGPLLTNSMVTSSNLTLKTTTTSTSDYAGYTSVQIKITTMKKV